MVDKNIFFNETQNAELKIIRQKIVKKFNEIIDKKKLNKINLISNGDDYQILFTANPSKSRIILKSSKLLGIKISKIGKICPHYQNSQIIDEKNKKITLKSKGYYHKF